MPWQTIVTDYQQHRADIRHVRDSVFLVEQGIDRELEIDDRDAHCVHALCYADGKPVGTGRLDSDGKVGRVAVLAEARRQGVGTQIMRVLESVARRQAMPRIWFHAQHSAIPFYEALGYEPLGEPFVEANILHIAMQKTLPPQNA